MMCEQSLTLEGCFHIHLLKVSLISLSVILLIFWCCFNFLYFLLAEEDPGGPHPQRSKPPKISKRTWRSQRVRPAPALQPMEESKDSKHPFALYGSGEKAADIAGRKTHNVGPSASTSQVFLVDLYVTSFVVTEQKHQQELPFYFSCRSTSQLYVLRPDGRWNARSRLREQNGGELSLLIWTRPKSWFNLSSTPGSLSICAASQLAPDEVHTHTHIQLK